MSPRHRPALWLMAIAIAALCYAHHTQLYSLDQQRKQLRELRATYAMDQRAWLRWADDVSERCGSVRIGVGR